jgi:hypothetical protein
MKEIFQVPPLWGANHIAKKSKIPQHMVDLYQKPSKKQEKQNDHMKLTSTLHPMRL